MLPDSGDEATARLAGLDLARQVPAAAEWLAGLDGPLVLGNYVYADGAANVAVCAAADALTERLRAARGDLALAFLATPTDVYAVPAEAVAYSVREYASRPRAAKRPAAAHTVRRAAAAPGLRPRRGPRHLRQPRVPARPEYALAKRLQRWRAAVAREGGATVRSTSPRQPEPVGR